MKPLYPTSYRARYLCFSFTCSLCRMRRDLESLKERFSALERHIEETDGVLTEAQVCVLEKNKTMSGFWPG